MMNFNDEFTKDFEEKFQKNLAEIRKISSKDLLENQEKLLQLNEFLKDFNKKPVKSPQDIAFIAQLALDLKNLLQKVEDVKLIIGESLNRKARAYFEHVKKLAGEGNQDAKKIYDDLKIHFNRFDAN